MTKFKSILENATRADSIVKDKYQSNREAMVLLGQSEAEITSSLPAAGAQVTASNSSQVGGFSNKFIYGVHCACYKQSVQDLRALMEEVRTLKAERETLEQRLRDPVADIIPKFLQALKDLGDVDEESISEAHLRSEYGLLQQQVAESVEKQEGIAGRIVAAHDQFTRETQSRGVSAREEKLKELAAGYDAFMELDANLTEGTKFYNDLTPLLLKIQNKVSDFTFARKTEKDDLLK